MGGGLVPGTQSVQTGTRTEILLYLNVVIEVCSSVSAGTRDRGRDRAETPFTKHNPSDDFSLARQAPPTGGMSNERLVSQVCRRQGYNLNRTSLTMI